MATKTTKREVLVKPFVKWAGGKGQLISQYRSYYPEDLYEGKITTYIEPFVGGGAVLLDVLQNYNVNKSVVIDINRELINAYLCVQNDVDNLILRLRDIQEEFLGLDKEQRKEFYYIIRGRYNNIRLNNHLDIEKAADFIFLNRTCFNSLYRVNMKGSFNVPIGRYKNPLICDEKNLHKLSILLQGVIILHGNYDKCLEYIDDSTFIYIDPPYRALNETAQFNYYSENRFIDIDQIKLSEFCKKITSNNVKIMISNSDPKNVNETDNFFDDLYSDFYIHRISAKRVINSKSELRGTITELLITNY